MICDAIGLVKIPDQHAGQYPTAAAYIEWYFERFYHAEYIIDLIWKALDERKLHYQSVVAFLHYNRPILFVSDAEEFLFHCFDAAGKFSRSAVAWMLWKFGVFKPAEGRMPHLIEKELFPPLPSDVLDEVRRSRDLIMSGGAHNNSVLASPLARSRDKTPAIDVDQIRASADALRNHRCHHEEEEEEEEEEEHK